MRQQRRYQFGILGLLLLTAIVAATIRGLVAYNDRPNIFQSIQLLIKGNVTDEMIAEIGDAVAASPEVQKLLGKKRIGATPQWLAKHVSVSKISGRSGACVLDIQVRAKSWEFKQPELKTIIDSAVDFIGSAPGIQETSELMRHIGGTG